MPTEITPKEGRGILQHAREVYIPGGVAIDTDSPISTYFGDTPSIDSFARARVSNPFTLFDSKQIWNDPGILDTAENYPLFFDNQQVSGAGTTTTFSVDKASTTLAVGATTAGERVRQTRERFNYQPGKSMLMFLTFLLDSGGDGITKRIGAFDENNGLFLQDADDVLAFTVRSSTSGSAVDTTVTQTNWNLDKLDGSGGSGKTLDKTKAQIFMIDYEWLGVGRVRFGFVIDGIPVYCHEVLNANNINTVYMSSPNNPVRCSIENDGTGAANSIEQICSTVIAEGGVQPNGIFRGPDPSTAASTIIEADTIGTIYFLSGIRLKSAYLSAKVIAARAEILMTTNDNFVWSVHVNPTYSSPPTWTDIPNSAVQYSFGDVADPSLSLTDSGTIKATGFGTNVADLVAQSIETAIALGSLIDGTPDELVVAVSPLSNSMEVQGALNWREAW